MEQMDLFTLEPTEEWVFQLLLPTLNEVIYQNNANPEKLVLKKGKQYSSVWIDAQMVFRICFRGKKHYFSVRNEYYDIASDEIKAKVKNYREDKEFQDFFVDPSSEGVLFFSEYFAKLLDKAIDSVPIEFQCCSHVEECSDAKRCVNLNTDLAMACGYRKVMKSGRIFYGKNRNID